MKRNIEKTDFVLTATKTYISEITIGKSYGLYIDYNKHFPNREEFVYADNGIMVTTLCFKYTKMKIIKLDKRIKITKTKVSSVTVNKEYNIFLLSNVRDPKGTEHILNNCGLYITLNCIEFVEL